MTTLTSGETESTMIVDVPTRFWEDHESRCLGGLDSVGTPVKQLARTTRVRFYLASTPGIMSSLDNLRSDATHYTSFKGDSDPMMRSLAASAAATLRAINKGE